MRLLLLCLTLLFTTTTWASPPECATNGICQVGSTCICTVNPDSSHDRYFFLEFDGFAKGHIYDCKMSNSAGFTFMVATAKVPDGAGLSCDGSCQRFPVGLILDTRQLVKPTDNMVVKYFVPGGDIPSDLHSQCTMTY